MEREKRTVQKMFRMTPSEETMFLPLIGYNGNWTWTDLALEGLGLLLEAKGEDTGSAIPDKVRVATRKKRRRKPK